MAIELAKAYLPIIPSLGSGFKANLHSQVSGAFSGVESIAAASGQKMGKELNKGLEQINARKLRDLGANLSEASQEAKKAGDAVANAQARMAEATEKASRDRAAAKDKVAAATQRVEKAERDHALALKKLEAAEADYARVKSDSGATAKQVEAAEIALHQARNKAADAADNITSEERKALRAREDYIATSKAGIATVKGFAEHVEASKAAFGKAEAGVDKAKKALKDFKAEAAEAAREQAKLAQESEEAAGKTGRAFAGIKGKINASLKGLFDPIRKDAEEMGSVIEREFTDAGKKSGSGFKDAFKGAFAGFAAYVGIHEIVGGFKSSIMAAGDLEQSVGGVDAVFKDNARRIHGWAWGAAQALGLSKNSYNEFATLIGAQLKNAGTPMEELAGKTNSLIGLGADLASMFGGTTAEAVEALSSALKGEMDPIEKYGISLNDATLTAKGLEMGIEKVGGAFDPLQKQLIVQALLFDQSADAQGNFAREADTFQGKLQRAGAAWEDLSAKAGEIFLPVMTRIMGFLGDTALPILDEFVGGIRAFKESWVKADGDITSSGFAGFMEELAFTLRKGYDTMKEWYPVWAPFTAAVGAATGTIVAYKAALTAISIAQGIQTAITTAYAIATGVAEGALWGLTAAQWAAIAPIALIVASIVGLVVGLKMAYDNVGWFRDMVDGAWAWIKDKTAGLVTWWTEVAWPAIGEALAIAGEWFTSLYRDHVEPVFAWIGEVIGAFLSWWNESFVPALSGALQMVGGWFTWLYESVIQPVWTGILVTLTVIGAIILTLFDGIVWAVSTILGPIFTWLWENVISPVFTWITEKIQGFATWWNDTLVPSVAFGIDVLKLGWQSVWDTVSLIWSWIGDKISAAWAWIRDTVLTPLGIFLDIVVGAAFRKLWDTVSLIWSWISDKISSAWTWVRGAVLDPMVSFLDATVGAAFRKLWENVSRVWDQISSKISEAWNWIKTNVLDPMGAYLKNEVIRFFELARDGIGQVWQGIKDLVREPVRFVVETVINGGFIKNYNKLAKFWDGKPLDELSMPDGFKVGGYTGDGPADAVAGIVHKGEYVLPKSATQALIRERGIGFLETLRHYTGHTHGAASGGVAGHCRHCAAASGAAVGHSTTASTSGAPPSGSSGIWGGFQHQISRAGRLFVPKMNFMGVNTENVAKAWMGRSAVEIIAGNGSPSVSFHTGGAGTYGFNAGSSIWMQNAVPGGLREAVLIHELGHALSLHHTMNRGSIMHPLQAGPTWPSALDYGSLVSAWGAPGEGVKTYEGGGGGFDLLGMIAEKLTAPVKKLFEMAQNKFAGNGFVNIPLGFGRKMLDSVVDWISNRGSGNASMGLVTPKLYDRGGIINRGIQLIDHQRDTPDYVLTNTQWAAMYQIAENTANTDAGVHYNFGDVHGGSPEDIARSVEMIRRHNEALALR